MTANKRIYSKPSFTTCSKLSQVTAQAAVSGGPVGQP